VSQEISLTCNLYFAVEVLICHKNASKYRSTVVIVDYCWSYDGCLDVLCSFFVNCIYIYQHLK